jgi:4-aminobutyrate aminotransferase
MNPPAIRAAEALVRIAPRGLDQVFLCTSGTDAVEAALKLARKATGRTDIIGFEGAFHGRTYGALSVSASQRRHRAGVGPFLPGTHTVPYPSGSLGRTEDAIARLFATRLDPSDVAAVIVEPVLGEGGYVVPPPEFLPYLRRLCDEHGIVLIVDEIQSGLGRTGRLFATDHVGVAPDILCVAKAFGNGLPIAAIAAGHGLMGVWERGDHGSTFGGNPIACAAAEAVVETLEREGLADRAARLGAHAIDRMDRWMETIPSVDDVRGLGLMIGIELVSPDRIGGGELAERVRARALARGLLLLSCGTFGNVLRVIPPLTIPEQELEMGLDIIEECLREAP